jgi:drug/metabolite transporter (DMT)-like permease
MIEQLISLAGALMILGAYAAQQFQKLNSDSVLYLILNLVGAAILAVIAIRLRQLGLTVVESAWSLVSLVMLLRKIGQASKQRDTQKSG